MWLLRYHQPGSVIVISTLALPSYVVSPTLARLVRVWFSPIARGVSSGGFPIRRDHVLDGLLGLLRVKVENVKP